MSLQPILDACLMPVLLWAESDCYYCDDDYDDDYY